MLRVHCVASHVVVHQRGERGSQSSQRSGGFGMLRVHCVASHVVVHAKGRKRLAKFAA
jgi:hypothetical protein